MWFWVVVAVLGLVAGAVAIARSGGNRIAGGLLFGAAAVSAVVIEVLIRFGAITVDQGTDLMASAVLVLIVIMPFWLYRTGRFDNT